MTVFSLLKKHHKLKKVSYTGPSLLQKSIKHINIQNFINYWTYADKFQWPNQPWYKGTGLHFNPEWDLKPHASQICGNHLNSVFYQDTLSFDRSISEDLFSDFKLCLVRCKITELASSYDTNARNEDWHKDESPFEALRVIIPLVTSPCYQIQLDNESPQNLAVGYAYAFDQSKYHRILCSGSSRQSRLHLILSVVTWFDKIDNTWQPNTNFNKRHPFEVFDSLVF